MSLNINQVKMQVSNCEVKCFTFWKHKHKKETFYLNNIPYIHKFTNLLHKNEVLSRAIIYTIKCLFTISLLILGYSIFNIKLLKF